MLAVVLALALQIGAAKPPEPLEEIFPLTALIVDAVVVEVKSEDKSPSPDSPLAPRQIVVLEVNRVVRGALPGSATAGTPGQKARIVVTKPASAYKLRVGIKGPWLLAVDGKTGERTILGRYGPDSYTFEKIEAKLAELKPAHLAPILPSEPDRR